MKYGYHCQTCNKTLLDFAFSQGDSGIQKLDAALRLWPQLKVILTDKAQTFDVSQGRYSEIRFGFLHEHEYHEIGIISEDGDAINPAKFRVPS